MQNDLAVESVIDKVRRLVETLGARGPLGLTSLARESGISKTTVYRLCSELVEWGLVNRVDGQYQLGIRLAELGEMAPKSATLADVGHPYIAELFATFRTTVNLTVPHGRRSVRCVDKIWAPGQDHSSYWMGVGTRAPMHCTAAGKAILAFSPAEVFAAVVAQPLVALTPFTIGGPEKLLREMEEIRRTGISWVRNEIRMDSCAIAVPILTEGGRVIGAIAVGLGSQHTGVPPEMKAAMVTQARRIAMAMSRAS
ncbi:IclR family transcriptional regulator [Nocardioides sp. BP30]|uniref:IclR family transcriptional regulator n=1 Tax=Nocardioides sp. BP30 TaxID=3036374 RepID=UPI002469B3E1|nr:IclR family transcriptional regulator [Nocardioides sp. BP30]WGL50790.1 IclR family transcriptional regulator [Nocardioides sp. BP30]